MSISLERKKIFRKEKRHSSVFRQAFQISGKYFSCHIHFNRNSLLAQHAQQTAHSFDFDSVAFLISEGQ